MKVWVSVLVLALLVLGSVLACGFTSGADIKTREQKFARMRQLAAKGDAEAQYNLGLMYEQGYGVDLDAQKAAVWFEQAADQGKADAQYRLGLLYFHGQGVSKNLAQAAAWYKKAAEQGNTPAQAALSNMYLLGEGVRQDHSKAAYWHNKSLKLKNHADFAWD